MLCAPHHDALYLQCDEEEAESVAAELEACFRDASETVLGGKVQLRVETGIVRHPDHYRDKDGKEIWDIVIKFLEQKRAEEQVEAQGYGAMPSLSGGVKQRLLPDGCSPLIVVN